MYSKTRSHLRTLKRRFDFLESRTRGTAPQDLSWDRQEMAALLEAIHWMNLLADFPWMKKELEDTGKGLVDHGKEEK